MSLCVCVFVHTQESNRLVLRNVIIWFVLFYRLDLETTGVLVFAKYPEAAEGLSRQFRRREVPAAADKVQCHSLLCSP